MEIVLDTGLDHLCRLSVHYTGYMQPRKKDSIKSKKERELKWRKEKRLCRKEGLVEVEAEVEATCTTTLRISRYMTGQIVSS